MCIFLLSGIMRVSEMVDRDVIRCAHSKRSSSLVFFQVFFFFFPSSQRMPWDLEWVQGCDFATHTAGLGHVRSCPCDYFSNRTQLLPVRPLLEHSWPERWPKILKQPHKTHSMSPVSVPGRKLQLKVLFIFLYPRRDIMKMILYSVIGKVSAIYRHFSK